MSAPQVIHESLAIHRVTASSFLNSDLDHLPKFFAQSLAAFFMLFE